MPFDPDAYLAKKSAPQAFDPDAYLKSKGVEKIKNDPSFASKALDYGSRVLDYPGGLIRTGVAEVAGLGKDIAQGKNPLNEEQVVKPEDVMAAIKGQAPKSSEYLKRLGVGEGPSVHIPLTNTSISARDVGGFASDVVADPLSSIAEGTKASGLLGTPSKLTESAGNAMYKSGLKKVDERLLEKGKTPISDILMQEGKWGGTKGLLDDTKQIGSEALDQRTALYDKATQLGAKIDLGEVTKGAESELARIKKDPGMAPVAEKLEEYLNRYKDKGSTDISAASDWKSNLYNSLPDSAFDATGKVKGPVQKFQKILANDFKNAIVDSANGAEKGLGDKISALNDTMGSTIAAERPMAMQIRRETTKNPITKVDYMLGGYGLHDPVAAAGILAAKKTGDVLGSTPVKTGGGLLLKNLAESGVMDDATRRALINRFRLEENK